MSLRRFATLVVVFVCVGCDDSAEKPTRATPPPKPKAVEGKRVKVGDNVYLEVLPTSRRVIVEAEVCMRDGALEQLLTRKNKKEHEAILAADIDARKLHEALTLAKAVEGTPARWTPKYRPPTGTTIKVTLQYEKKGKSVTESARSWIKNRKSGKELASDWVFAGSMLVENPFEKTAPKHYLANDGDVICVANFESALLDLPIQSSKDDDDRAYDAWAERIPPVGTKVTLILEPVFAEKK
jgi:hypothetical protein